METVEDLKVIAEKALKLLDWTYEVEIQEDYAKKGDKALVIDKMVVIYKKAGMQKCITGDFIIDMWAIDIGLEGDCWTHKADIPRGIDAVQEALGWFASYQVHNIMQILDASRYKPE